MTEGPRYLIGRGETLASQISLVTGGGEKKHPYTFAAAKRRLAPEVKRTAAALNSLPADACPNDEAVAILTLHPSYLAKSYFPEELLGSVGLRSIGSRAAQVRPGVTIGRQREREITTVEIYAAGKRKFFEQWAEQLPGWSEVRPGASELRQLERVYGEDAHSRLRPLPDTDAELFEAILHYDPAADDSVLAAFAAYVEKRRGVTLLDDRQQTGGLCFIPIRVGVGALEEIAQFSFLRGLRKMPQMRGLTPFRAKQFPEFYTQLPSGGVLNPHLRVAIFDGGVPQQPDLSPWVQAHDAPGVGVPTPGTIRHGLGVTSAVLFGPLVDGRTPSTPIAAVDHYRVVGKEDGKDEPNYYRILNRIVDVLLSEHYDFINISVGPAVSIDDQVLHLWTSKIDEVLSHGKTLAFFAVGNEGDEAPPENRLGPPADAINGLGVGACDSRDESWVRASYSSVGPGRSPGVVKPDIVAFGGTDGSAFNMLAPGLPLTAFGDMGTSYASPYALRIALQTAAEFGHSLTPLAVKSLLLHHAKRLKSHSINEVGWGRIPADYLELVTSAPDVAHVVYQGVLQAGKTLRAPVPVPLHFNEGPVTIKVTICYATEVEPQHPVSYTRAGLDVHFRPHAHRKKTETQRHADTAPFFRSSDYAASEAELRDDALKWEPVLQKSRRFNDSSALNDPVFDLHYVARKGGGGAVRPADIPYAMVVTVRQQGMNQLYDHIVARYRTQLSPLQPRVGVPVRVYQ